MFKTAFLAALALVALASTAEARPRPPASICDNLDVMRPCAYQGDFLAGVKSIRVKMKRERRAYGRANPGHTRVETGHRMVDAGALVSHPQGCPRRAFCGCGAAVRVFGSPVRGLWLAAEWLRRFPRTAPAPGMVAARRHHVMVLEADLGGGIWRVYDANSGRHATRIHARSIGGFTVVNPHGA